MESRILTILALCLLGWSCDDDESRATRLTGQWIEAGTKTDTLSFESFGDKEYMVLKRAELTRTGPYEYRILPKDSISLRWTLAAAAFSYNHYYFKVTDDVLMIGNFYESPSGTVLTFQKLK